MNRGIARRTVFETRQDVRYFLAQLAREARNGHIRIMAYAVLTTHFHLLLESTKGELSDVMRRVLNRYVRRFNRTRRRDGPLFRGRFRSTPVRTERYVSVLLRYIDHNAPEARLVSSAMQYPFGSAYHYSRERRPKWLYGGWLDARLGASGPEESARLYRQHAGSELRPGDAAVIESRASTTASGDDDWDSLIGAAPSKVLAWMQRKAMLADATEVGLPYVSMHELLVVVRSARREGPLRCKTGGERRRDAWPVLTCGLLRDLAGATFADVRRLLGCTGAAAVRRNRQHRRLLGACQTYQHACARVAASGLRSH
ncbi:MAG: transposase [Planctomycetota bacterium]|nr:transposase [Planctomycetota bacterium]